MGTCRGRYYYIVNRGRYANSVAEGWDMGKWDVKISRASYDFSLIILCTNVMGTYASHALCKCGVRRGSVGWPQLPTSQNAVVDDGFRRSKNIKFISITRVMASSAYKKRVMRVLSGFNTFFRRVRNLFDFNALLTTNSCVCWEGGWFITGSWLNVFCFVVYSHPSTV